MTDDSNLDGEDKNQELYLAILGQPTILENICSNLSFEEVMKLRVNRRLKENKSRIMIEDVDLQVKYLCGINEKTILVYLNIRTNGSTEVYRKAKMNNDLETLKILKEGGYEFSIIKHIINMIHQGDCYQSRLQLVLENVAEMLKIVGDPLLVAEDYRDYRAWHEFNFRVKYSEYEYETWFGSLMEIFCDFPVSKLKLNISIDLLNISLEKVLEVLEYFFISLEYEVILPSTIQINFSELQAVWII
jgi:hypothetical protein